MDTEIAICADSLTKIYRSGGGRVTVFDKLSLAVAKGERLAIVGDSGAGKSTLLHVLGGLDQSDSGTVTYMVPAADASNGSVQLEKLNEQAMANFRNRHLGFVWQNPSLLPEFSALENVMMPLLIRGIAVESASQDARQSLDEVGLSQRASHRAGELSGGEQQRVALARALVTRPQVLLADEPTGSLDHRTSESIFSLLNLVHESHALTSVIVTHNLSFAERCDRVLELDHGRLQPFSAPSARMEEQQSFLVQDATRLNGATYV